MAPHLRPDLPPFAAAQTVVLKGDIAANVARHVVLAAIAARHGARMIVFPELSLTGYEPELARELALAPDDVRLDPLRDAARCEGIFIVAGAPLRHGDGLPLIAALTFLPDGGTQVYTKQHLHGGEEAAFACGRGGAALTVEGAHVALAVCAEIGHASHAAAAAQAGAQLYAASVLVSEAGYTADAALLQAHAATHALPVLVANYGGPSGGWQCAGRSALWDEAGTLVAAAPGGGECLLLARRSRGEWDATVLGTDAAIGTSRT
ncbi:carbon-nitrogen hydrolase family protein [Pseudoduganella plicata]|uniref:Hydrolase n=1 Tax=Pseudoduganella plicata TaxID=321984 RepID=A0A4P7BM72_9BURK|nr:carbon-nitrogen hydrolase family protein [Pseudoduganella plicata]QBQ38835.1 carbon-nitrogen hydrolase family protein [Pseudoduganella plicata]GGY85470.1 hydrolase [Pseudoduganella plicata]